VFPRQSLHIDLYLSGDPGVIKDSDESMMSFSNEVFVTIFRLTFPNRIYYFFSSSPSEAKEWIDFFQWKIVSFLHGSLINLINCNQFLKQDFHREFLIPLWELN